MDALQSVAATLRNARGVVVLTGAGVSAESGLPTFRGDGGVWRGHDPSRLATPEAFDQDPALVSAWYDARPRRQLPRTPTRRTSRWPRWNGTWSRRAGASRC